MALLWLGIAVALVAVVLLHAWKERKVHAKGPLSLPFLGGSLSLAWNLRHYHDYITSLSSQFGTFRVAFPGFDYYFTVHPANLEHVLKTNFHNYVKGTFAYEKHQEFLGDGIFSVDGAEWKQQRKVASYEFSSRSLRDFCDRAFCKHAVQLASFLSEAARRGHAVDMQDAALRLTFDTYCEVGFGFEMHTLQNPSQEGVAFAKAFDECSRVVFLRYVDPFWKLKRWLRVGKEARFSKAVAALDGVLLGLVQKRRQQLREQAAAVVQENTQGHPDLLSRFLDLGRLDPGEYSDKKIRDIVLNFMLAGRDTTALALCWLLSCLCKTPHAQDKLAEEICQIDAELPEVVRGSADDGAPFPSAERLQSFANLLTYERLSKLHYLQACLQETLRLHPSVPLDGRTAVSADELPDGTRIKPGDTVGISAYGMGRMESLWGDDAKEFKPERFMKDGVCQQESPFKLPSFLAGPRSCLGKDFAFLQMKVTAAMLLRFFTFEVVPGHQVQYRVMLTLHMSEDGLPMHVLPRTNSVATRPTP